MEEKKYINIVRSFSHKLVPENHGIEGHRFAPLDYFASYGLELPIDTSPEEIQKESNRLFELAKNDVENAIKNKLEELKAPKGLIQEELDNIASLVKLIVSGKKLEAEKSVNEIKSSLGEKQLNFLRDLFRVF